MVGVAPISGTQSAVQSGMQQLRLQQAQREAQQAEQQARALQVQAAKARQVADRAEENARSLELKSDQANDHAGRARLGLAAMKTVGQMQGRLTEAIDRLTQERPSTTPAEPVRTETATNAARPVVNARGQVTGTLLSVAV